MRVENMVEDTRDALAVLVIAAVIVVVALPLLVIRALSRR